MQTSSFYLPGTSAGELAQEAMLWNEDLFFPTNSRILENLVPMIQKNSHYVLNRFLKFLSVSKIHTILYALIKFHKCFIDDNFWMGLLFQLGRNDFFNLDQLPLIQKYNNQTQEQNYNIHPPRTVISISD